MKPKKSPDKSTDTPLFETGVREAGDPRPFWKPLRCRLCGRRFARWNGTANHGLAHHEDEPSRVRIELEGSTPGLSRYVFYLKGAA